MATGEGIVFAAINMPNDEKPLVDCVKGPRSITTQAKQVIKAVKVGPNEKRTYAQNNNNFCLTTNQEGVRFLVVTPADFPRLTAFECLAAMMRSFDQFRSDQARLEEEVRKHANTYSDPDSNKVAKVKKQVNEAKTVMMDNVDKIIDRGGRIEDICAETDRLQTEASQFQQQATKLKYAMWKKRIAMIVGGIFVLLVIVFIVTLLLCRKDGFNFDKCKIK